MEESATKSTDFFAAEVTPDKSRPTAQEPTQAPLVAENQPPNPPIEIFTDPASTPPTRTRRQTRGGTLGLHFSSGRGLYAANNTLAPVAEYSGSPRSIQLAPNAAHALSKDFLSPEDFAQSTHHPPISAGISFQKTLTRSLSIETGITYTYLYSTFQNKVPRRDASMTLHYIGIPLNLSINLLPPSRSPLQLYLSAGTTVEKGLFAHYNQDTYSGDIIVNTLSDEKINGLQWSLQAAFGLSYRLHPRYSLFIEPKVSYYLDNNQPINARTEHPFIPGLNIGIRHTWK